MMRQIIACWRAWHPQSVSVVRSSGRQFNAVVKVVRLSFRSRTRAIASQGDNVIIGLRALWHQRLVLPCLTSGLKPKPHHA